MEKDTTTHKQKALSITTVAVEIKVMTVDGKRMTKSVFDQIPEINPFVNDNLILTFREGVTVLGYIREKDDGKYFLLSDNGQLCKCTATYFFIISEHAGDDITDLCFKLNYVSCFVWDKKMKVFVPRERTNRLHFMGLEERWDTIEALDKKEPGSGTELYLSAIDEVQAIRHTLNANRRNKKIYLRMLKRVKQIVAELEGHQIYIAI